MNDQNSQYFDMGYNIGYNLDPTKEQTKPELVDKMTANYDAYKSEMNQLSSEVESNFNKIETALSNINSTLPNLLKQIKKERENILEPINNTTVVKVSSDEQKKYLSLSPFMAFLLIVLGLLSLFGGTLLLPDRLLEEIAFPFEDKTLASFLIYISIAGINSLVVIQAIFKKVKYRDIYLFSCLAILVIGLLAFLFGAPPIAMRTILFIVAVQAFSLTFIGISILYYYIKIRLYIVKKLRSIHKDADILDKAVNEGFVQAIANYKERKLLERYEELHAKISSFEEGFQVGKIKRDEMDRVSKELAAL